MGQSQELKSIQTQMTNLQSEITELKEGVKTKQKLIAKKDRDLEELRKQFFKLKSRNLIVTEHAILRYIERGMELDIDQIAEQIKESVTKAVNSFGDGIYPISDTGLKAVVKGGSIVTVK